MKKASRKKLEDCYRFPGFVPVRRGIKGKFQDPEAIVIPLRRRQKKLFAGYVELSTEVGMINASAIFGISLSVRSAFISKLRSDGLNAGSVTQ
jgi:hypothetical protein